LFGVHLVDNVEPNPW